MKTPVTRQGWYEYYVKRFNLTEHGHAAQMALFYLFLALMDGEEWTVAQEKHTQPEPSFEHASGILSTLAY